MIVLFLTKLFKIYNHSLIQRNKALISLPLIIILAIFLVGCSFGPDNGLSKNSSFTSDSANSGLSSSTDTSLGTSQDSSAELSETPSPTITTGPTPSPTPTRAIKSELKIGDYILLGKYYNEPILWRCIDIDKNGPLMLSDRIIMLKAFDAAGNHTYADGTLQPVNGGRTKYGSNVWDTSNLRAWLNSSASAGNIVWPDDCPPIESKMKDFALNGFAVGYANEKGFLATGNFTANERKILKSVTQKVMLDGGDIDKLKDGGTEAFKFLGDNANDRALKDLMLNYETAFYQNVIDKMFILDVKQMYALSLKSTSLGKNYHIGKPTQVMIDNSKYKNEIALSPQKYWCNWIRTPFASPIAYAWVWIAGYTGVKPTDPGLNIYENGNIVGSSGVFPDAANDFYVGVRPAFYINLLPGIFTDGYGTLSNPYVIKK